MSDQRYLAHISQDGREQTVEEHLAGTAELCSKFAESFGCKEQGNLIGSAHDIGKFSAEFQERLRGGAVVDHSTAGAFECAKQNMFWAAGCIAGHHGGLPDYGNGKIDREDSPTLFGRLWKAAKNMIPQYYPPKKLERAIEAPKGFGQDPLTDSFVIRMLYSCLVDADYLDTERFMSGGKVERSGYDDILTLRKRLNDYILPWLAPKTELNRLRCSALKACIDGGANKRGLFTLTVPTGGGKTVSSLAFALEHAVSNGLDRVIYVIPYTSIIEQTADVFRGILGENNVIEHHSGVSVEVPEGSVVQKQLQALATENWDAPVIVTTAVRFFESMFSNLSSDCRKLHNIANSVIVFDEAQMIPSAHLRPCTAAIAKLIELFGSSVVLCTATQPVLEPMIREYAPSVRTTELCTNREELSVALKRTTIDFEGKLSKEELTRKLSRHDSVLCIVNSRKAAKEIFSLLPEEDSFHLSTLMYPEHRRKVLSEIRRRLYEGLPCRVVSTSLIEAGVDVDFPAVYRETSGLDSVIQAAGRCNREGKRPTDESIVTVFESDYSGPLLLKMNIGAAKEVLMSTSDPAGLEAIRQYFCTLLNLSGDQHDKYKVTESFRDGIAGCSLPFKTVAESFRFIDSDTKTVYISTKESEELIRMLKEGNTSRSLFRKLGQYGVSIYEKHYDELLSAGDAVQLTEGIAVLENTGLYNEKTGLSLNAEPGRCLFD